jgi:tRNA threonylcarbamoyladenosine biosynthesis protein TsaB
MFERVLIIETSGKVGQVAVACESGIIAQRSLPEARRHARDLAARSGELLSEQGWRARDLTAVIVCIGPGSFTGLRVGIASAKALAYATGARLLGIPAFEAVAAKVPGNLLRLEVIADALQDHVYCQPFDWIESWEPASEVRILPFADWLADIFPDSLCAGPGAAKFAARFPQGIQLVPEPCNEPDCASLLHVAQADPAQWQANAWNIEPIYLRGSSAEEKRKMT